MGHSDLAPHGIQVRQHQGRQERRKLPKHHSAFRAPLLYCLTHVSDSKLEKINSASAASFSIPRAFKVLPISARDSLLLFTCEIELINLPVGSRLKIDPGSSLVYTASSTTLGSRFLPPLAQITMTGLLPLPFSHHSLFLRVQPEGPLTTGSEHAGDWLAYNLPLDLHLLISRKPLAYTALLPTILPSQTSAPFLPLSISS